ncbi:MAG: hypothetical protein NUV72_09740 [Bauldia sp.]|nr:hypothetical protein [Bauldia sp.]
MAFRPPNYSQERAERNRAKDRKKVERLQRRTEDAEKRKAERDGLLRGDPDPAAPADTPSEIV